MSSPPETLADWLTHLEAQHPKGAAGIELGLERVRAISRLLGQHQNVPVIIVAGTNGKGSVCAMLERILDCAGYRVGLFSSPHLVDFNERVRVGGMPICDAALCRNFAKVEAVRGAITLTYFEFGTLAAWECFAEAGVDVIVLEVGLGGRLDAVNIYAADCAIVSTIDIDHTDYLGANREDIGFEKAGIFRAGKPAICADPVPPQRLSAHAHAIGAQLGLVGRDFGYLPEKGQWQFWTLQHEQLAGYSSLPHPALHGLSQLQNASGVLAALAALHERLPVTLQDICRGLREVELPGRFQVLPGRPTVILDVAHNPQAARALADNLDTQTVEVGFHAKTWAVFGMLRDKDIAAVVRALAGCITHWLPCSLSGIRAASAAELAPILVNQEIVPAQCFGSAAEAFRYARDKADEDDRIVVFGSFQTVADVLHELA
ncbi:MAG: bifunctional tetrahydrofolate synthase/dihydrofolate synthase [Sterolibacterium sp.]|nr:bifunctional tetrahydrofolate synthase/dihydrofolate synthase [Sterolibacterium sp.]